MLFDMGCWFPSDSDPYDYSILAEHYYEAALTIGRAGIRRHNKWFAIPMLFLLHHAFELQLKAVCYGVCRIDGECVRAWFKKTHQLRRLADWLRQHEIKFHNEILKLIKFLDHLDPTGEHTRYPEDTKGAPTNITKVRHPVTAILYGLDARDGYQDSIPVSALVRSASHPDVKVFFGGFIDALCENGYRGP